MGPGGIRALLVINDIDARRTLRACLASHGYLVDEAETAEEALAGAGRRQPDLVLMQADEPGGTQIETCRHIRTMLPLAGLVLIGCCEREEDKARMLEGGADDYIMKPFSARELVARLRAISRRLDPGVPEGDILRAGDLELNTSLRTLRRAGTAVRLSPIEFDLLWYLMRHSNVPIEHRRLLRAVWGPEYGSELEYLRTYIKRLRKKIENDVNQPQYLITVPWLGYSFCTTAERSQSPFDSATIRA